jgi:hypothetical protein
MTTPRPSRVRVSEESVNEGSKRISRISLRRHAWVKLSWHLYWRPDLQSGENVKRFVQWAAAATLAISLTPVVLGSVVSASATGGGFDQFGYNNSAPVFNGTGSSWCQGKLGWDKATCVAYMFPYANDQLIMKWNAAWDACNLIGQTNAACTGATLTNEWNGMVPGGSGTTEHLKFVWYSQNGCGVDYTRLPDGGYCIWNDYEVIIDQGMASGVHTWWGFATPNGFGLIR